MLKRKTTDATAVVKSMITKDLWKKWTIRKTLRSFFKRCFENCPICKNWRRIKL